MQKTLTVNVDRTGVMDPRSGSRMTSWEWRRYSWRTAYIGWPFLEVVRRWQNLGLIGLRRKPA